MTTHFKFDYAAIGAPEANDPRTPVKCGRQADRVEHSGNWDEVTCKRCHKLRHVVPAGTRRFRI